MGLCPCQTSKPGLKEAIKVERIENERKFPFRTLSPPSPRFNGNIETFLKIFFSFLEDCINFDDFYDEWKVTLVFTEMEISIDFSSFLL